MALNKHFKSPEHSNLSGVNLYIGAYCLVKPYSMWTDLNNIGSGNSWLPDSNWMNRKMQVTFFT